MLGGIMRRLARSTSLHNLNADRHMSLAARALYLPLNRLNNALPYASVDPRLDIRDFRCPDADTLWATIPPGASPSRVLSDLFWATLPWAAIHAHLGEVHVLDIGCGRGNYGPRLLNWAAGHLASYTGTDAHPHSGWSGLTAADRRLRYYQSTAEDFLTTIPHGTNVFLSQSALEHFDEDLTFFEQLRTYRHSVDGPVLQIHLMPSQACLRLFLFHGVRQYTPRTISRITRLFDAPDDGAVLYRLGGVACNRLHLRFVTVPSITGRPDRRATEPEVYARELRRAISRDAQQDQPSPAFYALVIHSRWPDSEFPTSADSRRHSRSTAASSVHVSRT
jgi:2-polyprenyl-3-methyl-5-hydroxy-6-metoxy-1,4-benzoquinol methylase